MKPYLQSITFLIIVNTALLLFSSFNKKKQGMLRLEVSKSGRYLVMENGEPFFWLGDTAWNLFIKLNRHEADKYLQDRSEKQFTVIQAHMLGWKIEDRNAYNVTPFQGHDFSKPNEDYWKHSDYIINKAASLGLYVALLPVWASTYIEEKKGKDGNASDTLLLSSDTIMAYKYGRFVGSRYKKNNNIIWILGGDVWGRKDAIYDHLAKGLTDGAADGDASKILISFHPQGGTFRPPATSTSEFYHTKSWLDFNMIQSGHSKENRSYERIYADYLLNPVKPTLDSEPCYEHHPVKHKFENGVFNSWDMRRRAYWSLFAGAFGFTYGGNSIWQMDKPGSIYQQTHFNNYWYEALNYEGARQMKYVRNLIESRPFLNPERIPDQDILKSNSGSADDRVQCARAADYSYLMVYTTNGAAFKIDLSKMTGKNVNAWWYNPRNGKNYNNQNQLINAPFKVQKEETDNIYSFDPPGSVAEQNDWILVIDETSRNYNAPGTRKLRSKKK